MILAPKILARLAALGFVATLIQVVFFAKMTFLGTSVDALPLVVMSLGLLGGPLTGAVAGFAIGLLLDILSFATLGASSLTLLAVGYFAGRYREGFGRPTRAATVLLAGAVMLLAFSAFTFIQLGLGVEADVSPVIARDAFLKTLYGMALILPVHAGIRRLLRPGLIDEQRRASRPVTPSALPSR